MSKSDSSINSLRALKAVVDPEDLKKNDGYDINPYLLVEEEGFNTRGMFCKDYYDRPDVKAGIRALADAYKRGDFVPPIIVKTKEKKVLVREGHRRRRALLLALSEGAEIKTVKVVEQKGDEAQQTLLIATSNDGLPLSPLERAVVYGRLDSWGWSVQEIADRVGRTPEHIRQSLSMLEMPLELKQIIQSGVVSATYALEIFKKHGDEAIDIIKTSQAETAAGTGRNKVTKRAVEKGPRLNKKIVTAMHDSFKTLARNLDSLKLSADGENFTLSLKKDEVDALVLIKEKLAELEAKQNGIDANQQQLAL